ncbi:competence/damage-inducible protein A [Olivibacter sp. SDN3]|uniref:competence/damage-inducible protein A n=1 Tax=Olivibacter sp. SDN3 TaxID=2764720 RepID=UPI0016518D08|nr:competence/damage-inducible protein A [Olivibacter sp. SDN3]QNL47800.1 competence/damage-inducible protein A [Olivibacter sp. SDN3]
MTTEIITIGDEILIGQIVDTNSAWIARQLNAIGIELVQISSVADRSTVIKEALDAASVRADIIFCTGGLGPTKDDVTKQTLAEYFNTTLYRDEQVLKHVETIFSKFNRPMLDVNRKQADVLANATVLHNETGTAPGMWIEKEGKIYVIMPGVPNEMKFLMKEEVLPRLKVLPERKAIVHETLLTAGIGESFLAEKIKSVEDNLPEHIHLAYLPKYGQVRLRLSAMGKQLEILQEEVHQYMGKLVEKIPTFVVGYGDATLEETVLLIMKDRRLTLSTAESCTGGYISHVLTSYAGSSTVFMGGAVTYSNQLKVSMLGVREETLIKYGAVSEEVAVEMVNGAKQRYATDYSIAVTGIAGPEGGTSEKPVGTVWIAVAGRGKVITRKFSFGNVRIPNIERAAANALIMLLNLLKTEQGIQ